ncbi:trypsin inhibitor ClTI-1-like [Acipenser oxyrinchus oxyrinchus]|uniref:Trypsin inhibitor ClTI-1-like n=1 Tax=Acipenser oxyrinchus oxyrinchus TaxID=40147 RepID=A0AAD8GHP3_ACIOX|nr:trypsin inhibitor ClTI-1-like [Acipenser oxyrinchus oxyrinchus]
MNPSFVLVFLIFICFSGKKFFIFFLLPACYKYPLEGCPFIFSPVCGTDGNSYANECVLCHTIRKTKMMIQIVKTRQC